MNLKLPQLLALAVGGILIYSAIKDVHPQDVIKAVLTGSPLPTGPGAPLPAKTPIVGPDGKPTGGYIDGQGRYIPPTDSTQQQPNQPKTYNENYTAPYTTPYAVVSV